jgi:hypothetical protein
MSLSKHDGPDHGAKTRVVYTKPPGHFTKRDAALCNMRVVGEKAAQLHYLTKNPTHFCRSEVCLSPEEIRALRSALQSGRGLTEQDTLALRTASSAGQIVRVNLFCDLQSFDLKPPTLREAAKYLQAHFEDGTKRSWITEYFNREVGKKRVWTVGDSIHANDSRYVDFDLWGNHFKAKPRDLYQAQGPRHSKRSIYTRWVAFDVDNHGDQPITSLAEWLDRYTALHELLVAERLPYLAQVNPKNASYQLWSPVSKWPLGRVAELAERIITACPWVREIYPTPSKWQIICPLRPDKLNLIGPGELAKVKCRTKTWCYDLVAAWRWHRNPTAIDPDAVRTVLARSFPTVATSSSSASANEPAEIEQGAASDPTTRAVQQRKATEKASLPQGTRGKTGPLRGRWLELLSEAYLDFVQPPVGAVVSFLTPQLRLFREGEVEAARAFLRDVIAFMRSKDWTFSDRVQNDPDELLRTLDAVCHERDHGAGGQELSKVDATRKRLDGLGFDGSFASLLHALATRRSAGRLSGGIDLPVEENDSITAVTFALMKLTKLDHQNARMLLQRILNHVGKQQEMAYSLLQGITSSMGVRLSTWKTQQVFKNLLGYGLIRKTKNYSRCPAWSIGNQYAVTEKVRFVTEPPCPEGEQQGQSEAATQGGGTAGISSNNTISRFSTNDHLYEPLDMEEIASDVDRLRSDMRFKARIRASRLRDGGSTE